LIDIEADIKVEQQNSKTRKDEITSQKQKELLKKGADTKRLAEIEKGLQKVNDELQFIEDNRDTVSDYKKDKREYIDKVDAFKYEKQKFEKQLEQEEKKFKQQKESVDKELEVVQELIKSLDKELHLIKDDNEAFDAFKELDFFKAIQEYFISPTDESETDKRAKVLIDEVKEIHYEKLHGRIDELRKTTTDFLGKFSDNNVFKFSKQLTNDKSFLDLAQNLSDFIDDKRIDTIEKEVNGKFALIVSTIATQTSGLVSNSGEIQKIIGKIN